MFGDLADLLAMFPEAVIAGAVIATVCACLGVFVILKRVVFIGITLAQVAAAGVAAAMVLGLSPFLGAAALTLATVTVLAAPFETQRIPRDAVLGAIFVLAAGGSILIVAKSGFGLTEVKSVLYGDLILTQRGDLAVILATLLPALLALVLFWRPIVYTFADREAARVLGIRVFVWELAYFYILGIVVSAASKVGGALLVFAYLVVPPSAALLVTRRLVVAAILSASIALLCTLVGLYLAFRFDQPTNHVIAVATFASLLLAAIARLVASIPRRRARTRR
ncbi:MAG: metal ABC transporter permease [Planctomycetes bacterium]|nr:metal ABC transporter permease [Planctomycetota bacterium]